MYELVTLEQKKPQKMTVRCGVRFKEHGNVKVDQNCGNHGQKAKRVNAAKL